MVSTGGEVFPVVCNEVVVPATILRADSSQALQVPFLVEQDFHLVPPQFVPVEIVPGLGEIGVSLLPFFHQAVENVGVDISAETITLDTGNDDVSVVPTSTV